MGQNGRTSIRQHDVRHQVTRLLEIFDELASQRQPKHDLELDVVLYAAEPYWDRAVRHMLEQLALVEKHIQRRVLICRVDLCDEETLSAAKLLVLACPCRRFPAARPQEFSERATCGGQLQRP
jgi:hypothetical protein